ncbi:MAG: GGDEF domain-containing protein [Betaproteobacteria bacterium]|nr:GGDEF domain-containing protein [Betaproteobacteria bacterium]
MNLLLRRSLKPVAAPLAVLVAAALLALAGPLLPASLAGLKVYGPYGVLALGAAIAAWFNRGRVLLATVALFIAYAGFQLALETGAQSFALRAALAGAAVFVPLNFLLLSLLPECGVAHRGNLRWLPAMAAQALFTAWVASAGRTEFSGMAWQALLDHWLFGRAPTPHLAFALMAGALGAAAFKAVRRRSPVDTGMAGALLAFLIACEAAGSPALFGLFLSASGAMLLVAVLQESHRMAFRDELTGLPSRRALNERLLSLGPGYTIAMVDVDHFKQFNDTHGHDVGDQVLKLVGARLAEVNGGGRPFRYGGEEFTVLFPDRSVKEALPHLEELRSRIESYAMAIRGKDRPQEKESGERRRRAADPERTVSVTVSIGAAQRGGRLDSPAEVLRAADKALYRAKNKGRNRVST